MALFENAGQNFLHYTRYEFATTSDQMLGHPPPPPEMPFSGEMVSLPSPDSATLSPLLLTEAIEERSSVREYSSAPLDLSELSFLLWCTQGVKWVTPDNISTFRTVPSAGARHPIETFLQINRVQDIEPGIYRYRALDHALGVVQTSPESAGKVFEGSLQQGFVRDAAVVFLWVADSYRTTWRYGERGFRSLFLDAGHICQNLYLAAQSVGCGTCAVNAFDDDFLNNLLAVDGKETFLIYMAAVGKRTDRKTKE